MCNFTKYKELFFSNQSLFNQEQLGKQLEPIKHRTDFILDGYIIFDDVLDMERCRTPYKIDDYKWNDTPNEDPEWTFMLARGGYLVDLAVMYYITANEIYLKTYKNLLFDFIIQNGIPSKDNLISWRPIDTGIRLTNLIKSLVYLDFKTDFSPEQKNMLFESMQVHSVHIKNTYIAKYDLSNWGVLAVSGVYLTGLFFENVYESFEDLFKWAENKLKIQLQLQFHNDGVHWEQSPLYHHEVVFTYAYLWQVLDYLDVDYENELAFILRKACKASYYYANSDDILLSLNDSDRVDFSLIYDVYRSLGLLNDKCATNYPSLIVGSKYYQKSLSEGYDQFDRMFFGRSSGFFAELDQYIYFTVFNGQHGSSHGHASNGSFTLEIENVPFIVDPARYTYMETAERLKLKMEESHNSFNHESVAATKISESWGYERIAHPQIFDWVAFDNGYILKTSWFGYSEDHKGNLFERYYIYFQDLNGYLIYSRYHGDCDDNTALRSNFNLYPTVEVNAEKQKLILSNQDKKMYLSHLNNKVRIVNSIYSPEYNKLSDSKRLQLLFNQIDKYEHISDQIVFISLEKDIDLISIPVFQGSKDTETAKATGVKLLKNNNTEKTIIFTRGSVVSGDKLFRTKENICVYGDVNIVQTDGSKIRL